MAELGEGFERWKLAKLRRLEEAVRREEDQALVEMVTRALRFMSQQRLARSHPQARLIQTGPDGWELRLTHDPFYRTRVFGPSQFSVLRPAAEASVARILAALR